MIERVREVLNRDRPWAVYALGDLAPDRREHCRWHLSPKQDGLILFYCEFGTPVLFAMGEVEEALAGAPLEEKAYIQIRPEAAAVVERFYRIERRKRVARMRLESFHGRGPGGVERLSVEHAEELRALYADGEADGESPDFFFDTMLEEGTFFGVRREGRLAAVAGTHLTSVEESAAAVGNVYTHRDWRGRGLARVTTGAVVEELLLRGIRTIALNVYLGNTAAMRVYGRLGFVPHCEYYEGFAARR